MGDAPSDNQAIKRGLSFVATQQQPDGGFSSFSSSSITSFRPEYSYHTVFVPALILNSLASINLAASRQIRTTLANFIMDEAGPGGAFNYWTKAAAERQTFPYPDDLDDTFCALIALARHNPSFISEQILVKVVSLLVACETKVGGPYRTWLASSNNAPEWHNIDLAVNSNVAYFLSLVSRPLPNLATYMEEAVVSGDLSSSFYPSIYPVVYYLARAYQGPATKTLKDIVQAQLNHQAPNPLETALALNALLDITRSTFGLDQLKNSLLASQRANGSWPADAFCLDPKRHGRQYYHGAAALTTALAIEALHKYQQIEQRSSTVSAVPAAKIIPRTLETEVVKTARHAQHHLAPNLRYHFNATLDRLTTSNNAAEIICLPFDFNKSLLKPLNGAEAQLKLLGLANLYGWLAYGIYDDFLDEEGRPHLLSVANVALRSSITCFKQAARDNLQFEVVINRVFDAIDGANAWELANCRFPRHGTELEIKSLPTYGGLKKLAERSLGHSLTPLAILTLSGQEPSSTSFKAVERAMRHYLIARQLSDDLHDWQLDVRRGHISFVVRTILRDIGVESGVHSLDALMPEMQKQFWYHSLPAICNTMRQHLKAARQALVTARCLRPDSALFTLLAQTEDMVNNTVLVRRQAIEFLRHYDKALRL